MLCLEMVNHLHTFTCTMWYPPGNPPPSNYVTQCNPVFSYPNINPTGMSKVVIINEFILH